MARRLSKSRFCTGLQCHRRLWLQVHEPDAAELDVDAETRATFDRGTAVGKLARTYFPGGKLMDFSYMESARHVEATKKAIAGGAKVIYEAAFLEDGIFVATDVLWKRRTGWGLTEVKSATKVKPEYIPDVAVQTHVLRRAGIDVERAEVMHLNRACCFPDLSDLFRRVDVTQEMQDVLPSVPAEAKRQLKMLAGPVPAADPGDRCSDPYDCPFFGRCNEALPKNHVSTLYRIGKKANEFVADGYETIGDLPDDVRLRAIADRQRRAVKENRLIVEPGLADALAALQGPIAYLDFETINPAIPVWKGCHPYDMVAAQMSCHAEDASGSLRHAEWIADGPADPREGIARAIVDAVRGAKTVLTYNVSFERGRIRELQAAVPALAGKLDSVIDRLADLLPIVRDNVYHPAFGGSFSLKAVLPALVPSMTYEGLDVAEGGTASAELERLMFDGAMGAKEKAKLRKALLEYCKMDTLAMVELVKALGRMAREQVTARQTMSDWET